MFSKKAILCTVCTLGLAISACATAVPGAGSGPRYVPRPDVAPQNYTARHRMEDFHDRRKYIDYEEREQCQKYRRLPRHSHDIDHCGPELEIFREQVVVAEQTLLPIIHSYTVYFDFDRSEIRPDAQQTLSTLVREIGQYNPSQITVTGYTDAAGPADYNMRLSQRRANAVSDWLRRQGVETQRVSERARGQNDLAVPTPDGVRLQENRRVVVDFRR